MEEFETIEYPPKLPTTLNIKNDHVSRSRCQPLSLQDYVKFLDDEERICDEHKLRKAVFHCGICKDARSNIWPFLFGIYQFNSTKREREVIKADNSAKYTLLKERWKTLLKDNPDVAEKIINPSYLRDVAELSDDSPTSPCPELRQQIQFLNIQAQVYCGRFEINLPGLLSAVKIIDKDVPRTDRTTPYFSGANNVHLHQLRSILITYSAYHTDVGYAQGMNDLAARFLSVLDSEVDAYWCLKNYLEHMKADFIEDHMLTKLKLVRQLLSELDSDLLSYLDQLEVGDLTFCHRWMLLSFKREFNEEDSCRCFEILSCRHLDLSTHEAEKRTQDERSRNFQQTGNDDMSIVLKCGDQSFKQWPLQMAMALYKHHSNIVHIGSLIEGTEQVVEAPQNTEFTFEVFMCACVLMHYRDRIFKCTENSDVFSLISSLTMNINLYEILEKTETLFYSYCEKSAINDCFQIIHLPSPENTKLPVFS